MIKLSTRITTQVRFKKSLDLKMKEIATKEGKTKDFNEVCDRLEKKYRNAAV